jgi:hypothetical protein
LSFLLAVLLFVVPGVHGAHATAGFLLEVTSGVKLTLPAESGPSYRYVRWDGGAPTVVTAGTSSNIFASVGSGGFACFAPILQNSTGDVLCALPGNVHEMIIGVVGNTVSLNWQGLPPGQPLLLAIVPLTGAPSQFIPLTSANATGYVHNTGGAATCYALLTANYGLYGSSACAVPGSAITFASSQSSPQRSPLHVHGGGATIQLHASPTIQSPEQLRHLTGGSQARIVRRPGES